MSLSLKFTVFEDQYQGGCTLCAFTWPGHVSVWVGNCPSPDVALRVCRVCVEGMAAALRRRDRRQKQRERAR